MSRLARLTMAAVFCAGCAKKGPSTGTPLPVAAGKVGVALSTAAVGNTTGIGEWELIDLPGRAATRLATGANTGTLPQAIAGVTLDGVPWFFIIASGAATIDAWQASPEPLASNPAATYQIQGFLPTDAAGNQATAFAWSSEVASTVKTVLLSGGQASSVSLFSDLSLTPVCIAPVAADRWLGVALAATTTAGNSNDSGEVVLMDSSANVLTRSSLGDLAANAGASLQGLIGCGGGPKGGPAALVFALSQNVLVLDLASDELKTSGAYSLLDKLSVSSHLRAVLMADNETLAIPSQNSPQVIMVNLSNGVNQAVDFSATVGDASLKALAVAMTGDNAALLVLLGQGQSGATLVAHFPTENIPVASFSTTDGAVALAVTP